MIASALFLLTGFFLLLKGAEWLIEGSCAGAMRAGISELIVGLTLISFGTSLPEFFINIVSRLSGEPDITLGDILGSNVANILLVLGLAAVIRPLSVQKSTIRWEIPFALAAAVVLALLADGQARAGRSFEGLTRSDGFLLLTLLALFLFYVFHLRKSGQTSGDNICGRSHSCARVFFLIAAGISALALGARGVVEGGRALAAALGIKESIIALTVIAVGSSLPELATSVVAAFKKQPDIAVGNVVGSNIFNICWILGISAFVRPLAIPRVYFFDIGAVAAATLFLFLSVFYRRPGVLTRVNGAVFLMLYVLYICMLSSRNSLTPFYLKE